MSVPIGIKIINVILIIIITLTGISNTYLASYEES